MFNPSFQFTASKWHRISINNGLIHFLIWLRPVHKTGSCMRWSTADFVYQPWMRTVGLSHEKKIQVSWKRGEVGEYTFWLWQGQGSILIKTVFLSRVSSPEDAAKDLVAQEGGMLVPW